MWTQHTSAPAFIPVTVVGVGPLGASVCFADHGSPCSLCAPSHLYTLLDARIQPAGAGLRPTQARHHQGPALSLVSRSLSLSTHPGPHCSLNLRHHHKRPASLPTNTQHKTRSLSSYFCLSFPCPGKHSSVVKLAGAATSFDEGGIPHAAKSAPLFLFLRQR